MSQIHRLTVSVNQSDVLSASLRCTRDFVNSTIVITDPRDRNTFQVCTENHVVCKSTNLFYKNNAPFNRGAAYRYFQNLTHHTMTHPRQMHNHYMLLLDADICIPKVIWSKIVAHLPPTTSHLLSILDRCIMKTPADFAKRNFKIETQQKGYVTTLGFFQLYKISHDSPLYPSRFPTAGVSDKVFGNQFKS